jgi:hypothetical protein
LEKYASFVSKNKKSCLTCLKAVLCSKKSLNLSYLMSFGHVFGIGDVECYTGLAKSEKTPEHTQEPLFLCANVKKPAQILFIFHNPTKFLVSIWPAALWMQIF